MINLILWGLSSYAVQLLILWSVFIILFYFLAKPCPYVRHSLQFTSNDWSGVLLKHLEGNKLTSFADIYVWVGNAFKVQALYISSLALTFYWDHSSLLFVQGFRVSLGYVDILDPLWSFLEYMQTSKPPGIQFSSPLPAPT